ncbi:hypothetical protein NIES4074_13250 [Cylindrospermum sp. NIES-4074]|nr:hypothetical protein NIES4074_13250 [Cylindrospermum sp. NIES-4074]
MVTLVVVINTLVSVILFYVAWRVWKLKGVLAFIADRLTAYERATHAALKNAPENIYSGQQEIYDLRQSNQQLQAQIQQVQQIISLLLLVRQAWQRNFWQIGSISGQKIVAK